MKAPDYVIRTDDGKHVLERDLIGGGVMVHRPGDELPEHVAAELFPEPETKPSKPLTKPRRARTKEA